MRPLLLAGGLALVWLVQFQELGVEGDVPAWGIAAVVAVRFFADLVGAWLAVSLARLVSIVGRLAWMRLFLKRW